VPLVRTGPTRAPRGTIATVAVYRHRLYALGVVGPVLRAYIGRRKSGLDPAPDNHLNNTLQL
jgi:hypothetical protein